MPSFLDFLCDSAKRNVQHSTEIADIVERHARRCVPTGFVVGCVGDNKVGLGLLPGKINIFPVPIHYPAVNERLRPFLFFPQGEIGEFFETTWVAIVCREGVTPRWMGLLFTEFLCFLEEIHFGNGEVSDLYRNMSEHEEVVELEAFLAKRRGELLELLTPGGRIKRVTRLESFDLHTFSKHVGLINGQVDAHCGKPASELEAYSRDHIIISAVLARMLPEKHLPEALERFLG